MYNQNLRLKYGSAPAQLLTKGFAAEKSLEKRSSMIRKEFDDSNNVSVRSQLSQQISKIADCGTETMLTMNTRDLKSKSAGQNTANSQKPASRIKESKIREEDSPDSSDVEESNYKNYKSASTSKTNSKREK
jgi:hypothetical protein